MSTPFDSFRRLLQSGDHRAALDAAEAELERHGHDPFWLTQLARAHIAAGAPAEALAAADRALELQVNNGWALAARGRALRDLGRLDEALQTYRDAEHDPRVRPQAHQAIVDLLVRTKDWQQVLDRLAAWSIDEPFRSRWELAALAGLGRLDDALALARRILEQCPDDRATLWQLADIEVARDGLDAVRSRYERLARIPSRPPIYGEIHASLCRRAGEDEAAALQYARLDRGSADPKIQRKHAFSLAKAGREAEAIPLFEELLRADPSDYYVDRSYAAACRRAGELERAWTFYGELLALHPEVKQLYGRRKRIRGQIERSS